MVFGFHWALSRSAINHHRIGGSMSRKLQSRWLGLEWCKHERGDVRHILKGEWSTGDSSGRGHALPYRINSHQRLWSSCTNWCYCIGSRIFWTLHGVHHWSWFKDKVHLTARWKRWLHDASSTTQKQQISSRILRLQRAILLEVLSISTIIYTIFARTQLLLFRKKILLLSSIVDFILSIMHFASHIKQNEASWISMQPISILHSLPTLYHVPLLIY